MYTMRKAFVILLLAYWVLGLSCNLTDTEGYEEYRVLASVTKFSVEDSSRANDIRVTMAGILGPTTAFSFLEILIERKDTLFDFAVFAKEAYRSGQSYRDQEMTYDTTLVLSVPQPQRPRLHYFSIYGRNGTFTDSSVVY